MPHFVSSDIPSSSSDRRTVAAVSRMTGADSPVIADSSTDQRLRYFAISGTIRPDVTTTISPERSFELTHTPSCRRCQRRLCCGPLFARLVGLPLPAFGIASAKLANRTVNHSKQDCSPSTNCLRVVSRIPYELESSQNWRPPQRQPSPDFDPRFADQLANESTMARLGWRYLRATFSKLTNRVHGHIKNLVLRSSSYVSDRPLLRAGKN